MTGATDLRQLDHVELLMLLRDEATRVRAEMTRETRDRIRAILDELDRREA